MQYSVRRRTVPGTDGSPHSQQPHCGAPLAFALGTLWRGCSMSSATVLTSFLLPSPPLFCLLFSSSSSPTYFLPFHTISSVLDSSGFCLNRYGYAVKDLKLYTIGQQACRALNRFPLKSYPYFLMEHAHFPEQNELQSFNVYLTASLQSPQCLRK